nr:MAG TPA: hypothetical protein [Caudoviricetes sp.]
MHICLCCSICLLFPVHNRVAHTLHPHSVQ